MAISKFGDDCDGVQAGILSEGGWDHFQGISVGLEAVGLHSLERLSVLWKQARNVDFRGTTTSDESTKIDRNEIVRDRVGIWMTYRFFTRHLTTQSASCRLRSHSSTTSWLLPVARMLTVRPRFLIPVMRTTLTSLSDVSSTESA